MTRCEECGSINVSTAESTMPGLLCVDIKSCGCCESLWRENKDGTIHYLYRGKKL